MARNLFGAEIGFAIHSENGDRLVVQLSGAGAPGSLALHDSAPQGSIYQRTDGTGELYRKISAGAGAATWVRMADNDDILAISFRSETPIAATGDVAPSEGATIDLSLNPFSDDDAPVLLGADFAVGSFILFGVGGVPTLAKVSNISGDTITITYVGIDPLSENDKLVVQYYLPDGPDAQEKQALILFQGGAIIKLSDLNWNFADGINLTNWNPIAGSISSSDTVQSALEKLWQASADARLALGVGLNATDMGSYTGDLLTDNTSAKQNFQELETFIESLAEFAPVPKQADAITSAVTLDSILVDKYGATKWLVTLSLDSNPSQRLSLEVYAHHNGTSLQDATLIDDTVYAKLKSGAAFNHIVSVDLSGSGETQIMRLRIQASSAISARSLRVATAF